MKTRERREKSIRSYGGVCVISRVSARGCALNATTRGVDKLRDNEEARLLSTFRKIVGARSRKPLQNSNTDDALSVSL